MRQLLLLLFVLLGLTANAQKISVSGRVTGSRGEPVPGATVLEKGTNNGLATNSDGNFALQVNPDATLSISAVGFQTQSVPVNGRTSFNVTLQVSAQDLNEVVVTGSRATEGRSNILTTAPVDVISAREIRAFAQTDVAQALTFTAPSFQSARQTISDGTDHLDPASLRGLGPDQVLVLLNGKRRHNQALVNVNGTVGRGSVGTDLNAIPISAVKRIEVLRDGAAALYGSDAIAGVINVQLKDDSTGVNVSTQAGQTVENDGQLFQADANVGIGLGGKGFLNVSGLFSNRSYTNRSGVDTAPLIYLGDNAGNYPNKPNPNFNPAIAAGGTNPATLALSSAERQSLKQRDDQLVSQRGYDRRNLRFGNSDARNYGGFLNGAFRLAPGLQLYGSAGIMQREGSAAGFSRLPGRYSVQNDSTKYPNGFLPLIQPTIKDRSLLAGLRGQVLGFSYDLSNVYGSNSMDFRVVNSINASLPLGTSPTEFYAGQIFFRQNTSNLTLTRRYTEVGPLATLNVAVGGEYRLDNYQITAGDEASYINGGRLADTGPRTLNVNVNNGRQLGPAAAGAQVFPGFQPSNVLNKSRTNLAGYVDLESDITEKLLVHLAGRAENYSDFGSNVSGQAAARFSITDGVALRGSVGNGFRAPSLQQRYFTNQSTQFVQGNPQTVLTANNDNNIVRQFGVGSLKQERSTNYSAGLTARLAQTLTFTADAYWIDIKDRIVLSTQFNRTNALVASYLNAAGATDVGIVQFFANAVNSRTRGIDLVLNERLTLSPNSTLGLTAAANFTETLVRDVIVPGQLQDPTLRNIFFDRQQRGRLENAQPNSKIVLSANYRIGKLGVEARTVRFGEVKFYDARVDPEPTTANPNPFLFSSIDQTFSAKWVTDLTLNFQLLKQLGLAVGANNIFNVYPDQYRVNPRNNPNNFSTDGATSYVSNLDNTNRGRTLYNPNQFGFNGAFYFARLNVSL
ncbi:TonB-dependent receptor [Hymenobacter arizonensis]|uniref:Iron complex outermembrane recepter protein n=1 Tax=Hymenobacter arizonensis TaxID=1227077 RepID=A0A1I6AJX2_HYMAR|nr:TonB-dependent receptor [Hymenobacter arizonensis]SFQ68940.1 iron complex outermembrane recepter protein [Hymenobacter arizonensis]